MRTCAKAKLKFSVANPAIFQRAVHLQRGRDPLLDAVIFQEMGWLPLSLVFKGGSTIIFGFQRGFHTQNALFLPYFGKML
jgi:hypothetical protein